MAPNMRDKTNYKIYVTKTNNIELANANLENLAIENAISVSYTHLDVYKRQEIMYIYH